MDPERSIRKEVLARLAGVCECAEEAPVIHGEWGRIRSDVLCRPTDPALHHLSLVVETKAHAVASDREIGKWIKQTADYVGTVPENGWPRVAAGFIWLVGIKTDPAEEQRILGMLQLAQHFRVGRAHLSQAGMLMLTFGPSAGVFFRGSWTPRALELLSARRVAGGVRRRLGTA